MCLVSQQASQHLQLTENPIHSLEVVLVPRCVPLYLVDVHGSCSPKSPFLAFLSCYISCYLSYLSYVVILLENRVILGWLKIVNKMILIQTIWSSVGVEMFHTEHPRLWSSLSKGTIAYRLDVV